MIQLRNQFDIHRTHATAATPTCCCCCCCCASTIGASSTLTTQMVRFNAKEKNKPILNWLLIATIGLWPLSIIAGTAVGFLYQYSASATAISVESEFLSSPHVMDNYWLLGMDPFTVGFLAFLFVFSGLVFFIYFACYTNRAFWITPIFIVACTIGLILDVIIGTLVVLGVYQLFDETFGGIVASVMSVGAYLALSVAVVLFASRLYRSRHAKHIAQLQQRPASGQPDSSRPPNFQ